MAQLPSPAPKAQPGPQPSSAGVAADDKSSLPEDLINDIRDGGVGHGDDASRSALFHAVVGKLARRKWDVEAIIALLENYPNGAAAKYAGRIAEEVGRSYAKVASGAPAVVAGGGVGSGGSGGGGSASSAPTPQQPQPQPHVLPTIRLRAGQLPRVVEETERALITSDVEVFSRAGSLVYPVGEFIAVNAAGAKTLLARLSPFTPNSFTEPVAEIGGLPEIQQAPQVLDRRRSANSVGAHGVGP